MILHPKLFDGAEVPLIYDLQYSPDHGVFYLSLPSAVLEGLDVTHCEERLQHNWHGELRPWENAGALGFGGCFHPADPPAWAFDGCRSYYCLLHPSIGEGTDRAPALHLHATLAALFAALEYTQAEPNSGQVQQQLMVGMLCSPGSHGASLWVELAPPVRSWVVANEAVAMRAAHGAMVDVTWRLWPSFFTEIGRDFANYSHRAWLNDPGLILEVPGDATSLCPDWDAAQRGPGWKLDGHNVDCDVQGLALLAGVCRLTHLSRSSR